MSHVPQHPAALYTLDYQVRSTVSSHSPWNWNHHWRLDCRLKYDYGFSLGIWHLQNSPVFLIHLIQTAPGTFPCIPSFDAQDSSAGSVYLNVPYNFHSSCSWQDLVHYRQDVIQDNGARALVKVFTVRQIDVFEQTTHCSLFRPNLLKTLLPSVNNILCFKSTLFSIYWKEIATSILTKGLVGDQSNLLFD